MTISIHHTIKKEENVMISSINRSAVIITPKQTFFNMVANITGEQPDKSVPPFTTDESTIYLIEEANLDDLDLKERMESCYKNIFFEELEGWFTDKNRWPKDITWKEFISYFHISYQTMVIDTLDEDIKYE